MIFKKIPKGSNPKISLTKSCKTFFYDEGCVIVISESRKASCKTNGVKCLTK